MRKKKNKFVEKDSFMLVFGFSYPSCKQNLLKYVNPPSQGAKINQILSKK